MKHLTIVLITLLLLAPATYSQILPDAPAAPPDPSWNRLRSLAIGQSLVVTTSDNRLVHCLFASVTETYLFCNPPGNPAEVGFRFDRAEVLSVDFDRTDSALARGKPTEHNYHPAWISSMIAGGLVVGLAASQNTDASKAAQDGFIGAAVVGLIGAPFAFLPHPYDPSPCAGPVCGRYPLGLRLSRPSMPRSHRIPLRWTLPHTRQSR
jgi:hypothetical protein